MTTIALVGNAKFCIDYSDLIDSADIVVRFNNACHFNHHNGSKTDILCLTNLSDPGRRFAKYTEIKNLPFIDDVQEIWFPRPGVSAKQFWIKPFFRHAFLKTDYAKHIVYRNQLKKKKIIYFSNELYEASCTDLEISPDSFQLVPSTGYLALKYVLDRFRDTQTKILLLGFSFEGTNCHPWDKEKSKALQLHQDGQVTWLPVSNPSAE